MSKELSARCFQKKKKKISKKDPERYQDVFKEKTLTD